MKSDKNGAWELFVKTGLPEAFSAYSATNVKPEPKERHKGRGK